MVYIYVSISSACHTHLKQHGCLACVLCLWNKVPYMDIYMSVHSSACLCMLNMQVIPLKWVTLCTHVCFWPSLLVCLFCMLCFFLYVCLLCTSMDVLFELQASFHTATCKFYACEIGMRISHICEVPYGHTSDRSCAYGWICARLCFCPCYISARPCESMCHKMPLYVALYVYKSHLEFIHYSLRFAGVHTHTHPICVCLCAHTVKDGRVLVFTCTSGITSTHSLFWVHVVMLCSCTSVQVCADVMRANVWLWCAHPYGYVQEKHIWTHISYASEEQTESLSC